MLRSRRITVRESSACGNGKMPAASASSGITRVCRGSKRIPIVSEASRMSSSACWLNANSGACAINGENLTGVRQTRWNRLIRPQRADDGRWTADSWAPLEGRNVNGGARLRF